MIGESCRNAKGSQCFKYQDYGHFAAQYPSRNLLISEADDDEIDIIVYELTGSTINSDDVRISNIQLGVIKCSHTTIIDENWHRSSVFYTYVTHE